MRVQFVVYTSEGDRVVSSAIGNDLRQYNWDGSMNNMPACYLIGLLAGKRALANNIQEGVFDIGQHESIHGTNIYGVLKGVLDAGVNVPHGESVIPDEARLQGKHIDEGLPEKITAIREKIEADYE
jgi:large subunit ribosomal protein L18